MSYCRWSCDYYRSDLYVFQSDRGWESYVAGRRINVDPPADLVDMPKGTAEAWVAAWTATSVWYASLKVDGQIPDALWLDLDTVGPEARAHYIDATPGECLDRLRALSAKGFNVPAHAIEMLEEEVGATPGEGEGGGRGE